MFDGEAHSAPILPAERIVTVNDNALLEAATTKGSKFVVEHRRNRGVEKAICWAHTPDENLSLLWFLSIRGSENFHIYIWLLKDMAWCQSWYDNSKER